jgi:hypothetical protein
MKKYKIYTDDTTTIAETVSVVGMGIKVSIKRLRYCWRIKVSVTCKKDIDTLNVLYMYNSHAHESKDYFTP